LLDKRKKLVNSNYFTNYRELKIFDLQQRNLTCSNFEYQKTLYKTKSSGKKINGTPPLKLPSKVEAKRSNPVLSQDQHLKMLLETESIDICISTSSLKLLMSAMASPSNSFEIPIIVKTDRKGNKTVVIDKPLPPVRASTRSRLESYLKQKTRQLLCKDNGRSLWYSVWMIGDLNIIIRSNLDYNGERGVQITVKPEYQLERGKESLTESMHIQDWIATHVKPATDLLIATVDPIKEQIIDLQFQKPFEQVDNDTMKPHFHTLHEIFIELKNLDGGSYYICKARGTSKVHIMCRSYVKSTSGFPSNPLVPMTKPGLEFYPLEWNGRSNQIPNTFAPLYKPLDQKFIIPFHFCDLFRKNRCKKKCGLAHLSHNSLYVLCFDKLSWFEIPGLLPFELGNRDVELTYAE
jgi:hypothetical protein